MLRRIFLFRALCAPLVQFYIYFCFFLFVSFRHTVARARGIFRFTSSRDEHAKNRIGNNADAEDDPARNARLLRKEDSASEPLFERGHLLAHQRLSNESTTSTKRSEDTVSTARSSL